MKIKLIIPSFACKLCAVFLLAVSNVHAAPISLYDYMSPYSVSLPDQTGNGEWTFHYGDNTGTLMPLYASDALYYGDASPALFGAAGGPGSFPATLTGGSGVSDTNGIFVHTSSTDTTAIVYNVQESLLFNQINLTHELVLNGSYGDGMTVTINSIIDGASNFLGSVSITSNVSQDAVFNYAGLAFQAGDKIEFVFDKNFNINADHGWVDINFSTSAPAVPIPAAVWLFGSGLIGLIGIARRKSA